MTTNQEIRPRIGTTSVTLPEVPALPGVVGELLACMVGFSGACQGSTSIMSDQDCTTGKILIVDDELRNLRIVEELLDDFDVETARSGAQALEKLRSFSPDLVLLDVMMPVMEGFQVL